uniref:MgtC/SapB/SrpB/YhiD N-terminal domain-containing protein n=1 Tax=Tetraselmis sp. GSL018 TaxID=582737 RepID=A0A061REW7_9CHLO
MAGFQSGGPPTLFQRLLSYYRARFSHAPARDGILYGILLLLLVGYGILACAGPFLLPACDKKTPDLPFKNPDYDADPCLTTRFLAVGGLTLRECQFIRNILMAVFLGCIIGYERRAPDRAAGIRTMSLTALGACCFTIGGNFTCQFGPMNWDSSRISASIPSGVGFLGAGIIWKGFVKSEDGGPDVHQVHGLTTAASVWLSAAIGTACGGNLYAQACFTVIGVVLMLRFGPRNSELVAEPGEDEDEDEQDIAAGSDGGGRQQGETHPAFAPLLGSLGASASEPPTSRLSQTESMARRLKKSESMAKRGSLSMAT